jgi:hypothetical protein
LDEAERALDRAAVARDRRERARLVALAGLMMDAARARPR